MLSSGVKICTGSEKVSVLKLQVRSPSLADNSSLHYFRCPFEAAVFLEVSRPKIVPFGLRIAGDKLKME